MPDHYFDSSMEMLTHELLTELLAAFAHQRGWTDVVHYRQAAAEIIDHQLTVEFRAFVQYQISY